MTSWIREFLKHLNTQEICDEAVSIEPLTLVFVPNHFKTQELCNEAVHNKPHTLWHVPGHLKMQEMCDKAMRNDSAVFFLFLTVLKHKKCAMPLSK